MTAAATSLDCDRSLGDAALEGLRAGEAVSLTGRVITLRDASAARLAYALEQHEALPIELDGRVLYAVGPSPAKPGEVIGSAGPTTTARMGRFLPTLLAAGIRVVIGKGELHGDDMAAFVEHRAVYLAAVGGLGALLAKHIDAAEVVALEELGAEALYELRIRAFPAVVIIDRQGRNYHELARARWRRGGPAIAD